MPYHRTDPKELLLSFPQMRGIFERMPTDDRVFESSEALREWADDRRVGDSAAHIVNLVCAVIDNRYTSGEFDFIAAMCQWDADNKAAFKNWLNLAFP